LPKSKTKELVEWRASHFGELESTLKILKSIRDDDTASNKDRIEASKSIGRLLSAMSPAKAGSDKPKPQQDHKPTQDEWDEIEKRLAS